MKKSEIRENLKDLHPCNWPLLPKPRVATKADLARPNTHEPETLRQPGGPATHCYLCCEEWRDHLTNEEEEEELAS